MSSYSASATLSPLDEPPSRSIDDIPDGEYVTVIEDIALTLRFPSAPAIVWTLRICGGSHSGRLLRKVRPVTERSAAWVEEDLAKCGLKLDAFADLPNRMEELRGRPVRVAKRTRADGGAGVWILWPGPARDDAAQETPF